MDKTMKWIRLWCERLTSPESDTWAELGPAWELYTKLLCLAGCSDSGGKILIPGAGLGYTQGQLAALCRIPPDRYQDQLAALIKLRKVSELPDGILSVTDWRNYQTEYDRQKGYRQRLQAKVTDRSYATEERREKREERREKKEERSQHTISSNDEPVCVSEGRQLAELLHTLLLGNYPGLLVCKATGKILERTLQKWADEFDRMLRGTSATPGLPSADIERVIRFAQVNTMPGKDGFCWARNVQSPAAIKRHFDRLISQAPIPEPNDGKTDLQRYCEEHGLKYD